MRNIRRNIGLCVIASTTLGVMVGTPVATLASNPPSRGAARRAIAESRPTMDDAARHAIYEQNLDFVNQALEKHKQRLLELTADLVELRENPVEAISGRAYRVGDQWDIISYYDVKSVAAPGGTSNALAGKIASFHYQVKGLSPLQIEVTETTEFNPRKTDASISSVTLVFDSNFHEISKTYHGVDGSTRSAFVDGMHSRGLPLEMYGIDAPDVASAEPIPYRSRDELVSQMPSSVAALASAAHAAGLDYDQASAKWMETADGFGRDVEFAWQSGKPWPSYIKTVRGMSILVRSSS